MALPWGPVFSCSNQIQHYLSVQESSHYRFVFSLTLASFLLLLTACGPEDGNIGATATLSWDPTHEPSVRAYTVHYGKESTGTPGSCNYENAIDVSESSVMITGLEFSTHYYFSVSAYDYNGLRSECSDEVSKLTPELEVHIGEPPVRLL